MVSSRGPIQGGTALDRWVSHDLTALSVAPRLGDKSEGSLPYQSKEGVMGRPGQEKFRLFCFLSNE